MQDCILYHMVFQDVYICMTRQCIILWYKIVNWLLFRRFSCMECWYSNKYLIIYNAMHSYSLICVCDLACLVWTLFLLRKNLSSSRAIKPSSLVNSMVWNQIFNMYMMHLPTDTDVALVLYLFCNAYLLGYQRTYMRCIVPLQHQKTQRTFIRW
jgi:hypothetical protein